MKRSLIIAALAISAVAAPACAGNGPDAGGRVNTAMVGETRGYDTEIGRERELKDARVEVTYSPNTQTFTISGPETIVINPPVQN